MHQPTPHASPHHCTTDRIGVARRATGGSGPKSGRLLMVLSLIAAIAMSFTGSLFAQGGQTGCIVRNPSFETFTATPNTPGYSWNPATTQPLPGVQNWSSGNGTIGGGSPDVFWPNTYVPNNFMTTPTVPIWPFHGKNYAGISSGRFYNVWHTEIISAALSANPVGQMYEVRGRFAMGPLRNQPARIQVSLTGPSGTFIVGSILVNNSNWNLFSRIINLPTSVNYNRIVIQGVDSTPQNWGAYTFIDSVDICPIDPCDFLRVDLKPKPNAAGQCCFDVYISNNTPATIPSPWYIRTTVINPVQIINHSNGAGFASVANYPTQVTWGRSPYGSNQLLNGTGMYVGNYCINPNGAMPQIHVLEFLDRQGRVICRDTVETKCESSEPCIKLHHPTIACGPIVNGNQTYTGSINVSPVSGTFPPGSYVTLHSPQGTITGGWGPFLNNWWVSGANTLINPFTFTDTPPVDGKICVIADYYVTIPGSHKVKWVCADTLCFELPKCPKPCCDNFTKIISNVKITYSNGTVNFSGCALAGPGQIKRFSATVVSSQIRTRCAHQPWGAWTRAFGDISNAALAGAVLPGPFFVNAPFGREAVFGGPNHYNCVSFNPCRAFKLAMQFPPPPTSLLCEDSLMFCIRFSFTDCSCLTCDTVVCYKIRRKKTLLPWLGDPDKADPVDLTPIDKANVGVMDLSMNSNDDGTLSVTLPESSDDVSAIRIVGMSFRPLGVALTGFAREGGEEASITGNTADMALDLSGGQSAVFNVSYSNSDGERVIGNYVRFRYMFVGDEDREVYETNDILVEGYTPEFAGGDEISEESRTSAQNVRTYALHVEASNTMGNDVHGLKVTVNGESTRLIAVGPVGDGIKAVLVPGEDQDGNSVVQVDPDSWEINKIVAGGSLTPIYLTFAEAEGGAEIDYATLNENGSVISSGSVSLGSPLRIAAGTGSDVSADQANVLNPVFPNPSGTNATASFQLSRAGKVSLSIRDLNGREVARQLDGRQLDGGNHLVSLKTDGLPQGTYMVVLDIDGQVFTRTLTVVR